MATFPWSTISFRIPYIELRDETLAQVEQFATVPDLARLEFMNVLVTESLLAAVGFEPNVLDREKEICTIVERRIAHHRVRFTAVISIPQTERTAT